MSRSHDEDDMQIALFDWVYRNENRPGCTALKLAFHCPNGGKRGAREGARFKRMGVRAGVWDVIVPVPRGIYAGLAIELKTPTGRLTPEQKTMGELMTTAGWETVVCRKWDTAAWTISTYLELDVLSAELEAMA